MTNDREHLDAAKTETSMTDHENESGETAEHSLRVKRLRQLCANVWCAASSAPTTIQLNDTWSSTVGERWHAVCALVAACGPTPEEALRLLAVYGHYYARWSGNAEAELHGAVPWTLDDLGLAFESEYALLGTARGIELHRAALNALVQRRLGMTPASRARVVEECRPATADAPRKLDAGKLRYDLTDPFAEAWLVSALTYGVAKYSAENWRRFSPEELRAKYGAALKRHLEAFLMGEVDDPETGLPHLALMQFGAMVLTATFAPRSLEEIQRRTAEAIARWEARKALEAAK